MTKPNDPDSGAQNASTNSRRKHAEEIKRVADRNHKAHLAAKKVREAADRSRRKHLSENAR
jgi:hypothetical protein